MKQENVCHQTILNDNFDNLLRAFERAFASAFIYITLHNLSKQIDVKIIRISWVSKNIWMSSNQNWNHSTFMEIYAQQDFFWRHVIHGYLLVHIYFLRNSPAIQQFKTKISLQAVRSFLKYLLWVYSKTFVISECFFVKLKFHQFKWNFHCLQCLKLSHKLSKLREEFDVVLDEICLLGWNENFSCLQCLKLFK